MAEIYPRPFKPGPIEPVVEVGENVLTVDRVGYDLYRVAYIEEIPLSFPLVANIGAIAAGATAAIFNPTALLDMQEGQVGQYRAQVVDDIHVVINQPQAVARFSNRNQTARLNAFLRLLDPCDHLSEFYIMGQDRIFLTVTNPTQYALVQARVSFYGFKYVLEGQGPAKTGEKLVPLAAYQSIGDARHGGQRFTVIPLGGWAR